MREIQLECLKNVRETRSLDEGEASGRPRRGHISEWNLSSLVGEGRRDDAQGLDGADGK